ncbi:MAG TPA: metalloregulator ArsR/SmtB family transcription factor [Vicinamibacterales bacterium]|jgi:DNA-binding transcriptional ArsR family regulator|nr:metalloregulator ArsR/SmtB family transcription factor [Vicinamibacterales bacterium]
MKATARAGRRAASASAPASGDLQAFKARFFRALAHPTRIRLLERLVRGPRTVQQLQDALGLDQPLVSQQLAVLRTHDIVSARKEGLSVRYTLRDPLVGDLLDVARRIFNNHLASSRGLLRELQREARRDG